MGSRHSKPSSPPKQLRPSKSKSKSKSKSSHKTKISRPLSKTQLNYPSLPSPTFRRLPHTPKKTNPTPEEDLRERVNRYRYEMKKAPLPPISRPPTRRGVVRPAPAPAKDAAYKKESQYQFKPLNEIGRPSSKRASPDPKTLPQQAARVQLTRKAVAKPYEIRPKADKVSAATAKGKNSGYALYPPKQKGDVRGGGGTGIPICPPSHVITTAYKSAKTKPQARYGGTRKDGNGEWWVLVLADGKWHRSRELGIKPPSY